MDEQKKQPKAKLQASGELRVGTVAKGGAGLPCTSVCVVSRGQEEGWSIIHRWVHYNSRNSSVRWTATVPKSGHLST